MGSTTLEGVEFERFIQSAFRVTGGSTVVYVDPHRIEDGPPADLILVTHDHFDHMDANAINAVSTDKTVIVSGEKTVKALKGRVKGTLVQIGEGKTTTQNGVEIRAVAGYNSHHPRGANLGYVFRISGMAIYHGGDTGHVPEMARLGPIDVALVPIGGKYTMDEQEAAAAVKDIRPRVAIPMHYGYATGGDPQKFSRLVGQESTVIVI